MTGWPDTRTRGGRWGGRPGSDEGGADSGHASGSYLTRSQHLGVLVVQRVDHRSEVARPEARLRYHFHARELRFEAGGKRERHWRETIAGENTRGGGWGSVTEEVFEARGLRDWRVGGVPELSVLSDERCRTLGPVRTERCSQCRRGESPRMGAAAPVVVRLQYSPCAPVPRPRAFTPRSMRTYRSVPTKHRHDFRSSTHRLLSLAVSAPQ